MDTISELLAAGEPLSPIGGYTNTHISKDVEDVLALRRPGGRHHEEEEGCCW